MLGTTVSEVADEVLAAEEATTCQLTKSNRRIYMFDLLELAWVLDEVIEPLLVLVLVVKLEDPDDVLELVGVEEVSLLVTVELLEVIVDEMAEDVLVCEAVVLTELLLAEPLVISNCWL